MVAAQVQLAAAQAQVRTTSGTNPGSGQTVGQPVQSSTTTNTPKIQSPIDQCVVRSTRTN